MAEPISRRDFLKLGTLSLAGLAFLPGGEPEEFAPERPIGRVRVTTTYINRYEAPDFKSKKLGLCRRDEIFFIYEEIISPYGPRRNPRWYRRREGDFVHSGHLQRVEGAHLNPSLPGVPEGGQLGEITVPVSPSLRLTRISGWVPLYRLYYGSLHWITSLEEGPDGKLWYGLTDELLRVKYCVPAAHVRPVEASELAPIAAEMPPEEKRIEVSLAAQVLTAYQGEQVVRQTQVSTGLPDLGLFSAQETDDEQPTDTPKGHFRIQVKVPSKHMGDGKLTDDPEAYELPGVPWVSFFHASGVAFHGTYWHDNFGQMMSHGCVNMRNEDALWLYRWTTPVTSPQDWNRKGNGTKVYIF